MSLTHCDQCRISSHRCEPSPPNRAKRKEITGIESLSTICSTISSDFVNHKKQQRLGVLSIICHLVTLCVEGV